MISRESRGLNLFHRLFLALLWVGSYLYGLVVFLRNQGFQRGLFRQKELALPVLSVGNILAGGAGKTPTVIFLTTLLKAKGLKPVILTRGYKLDGGTRQAQVATGRTSPTEVGDEPVLLARRLGVPVLVGRDRHQSGTLGVARFHPDLFLLDDGFQHLSLRRDLDLVVIDASRPLAQPLLPRGYLREPLSGLKRADGFLLTRVDQACRKQVEEVEEFLATNFPGKEIFHAYYQPLGLILYDIWRKHERKQEREPDQAALLADAVNDQVLPGPDFEGKKVGLFVGVASPSSVVKTLTAMGVRVVNELRIPDHQGLTNRELVEFSGDSRRRGAEALITTEKDAVKLTAEVPEILPLYVLLIEVKLLEGKEAFFKWLQSKCPLKARTGGTD